MYRRQVYEGRRRESDVLSSSLGIGGANVLSRSPLSQPPPAVGCPSISLIPQPSPQPSFSSLLPQPPLHITELALLGA